MPTRKKEIIMLPTIKYGDHSVDTSKLPEVSVKALLSRGLSHFLGNEQASKVTAKIVTALALSDETSAEAAKAAVKAFRISNEADCSAWTTEAQTNALKALADGTVGVRAAGTGPKLSPIETVIRRLAKGEVIDTLKANNIAVPKGEDKVSFADGKSMSMDELVERRIAKHGDRLKKAAAKELADKARKLEQAAKDGLGDLTD